jgi:hypothetical protein
VTSAAKLVWIVLVLLAAWFVVGGLALLLIKPG